MTNDFIELIVFERIFKIQFILEKQWTVFVNGLNGLHMQYSVNAVDIQKVEYLFLIKHELSLLFKSQMRMIKRLKERLNEGQKVEEKITI